MVGKGKQVGVKALNRSFIKNKNLLFKWQIKNRGNLLVYCKSKLNKKPFLK